MLQKDHPLYLTEREVRSALPPFDPLLRYTVDQARAYLKTSRMSVYKLLHSGDLEGVKEGGRTFITGRSIAARCAPPEPARWIPNLSHRAGKRRAGAAS